MASSIQVYCKCAILQNICSILLSLSSIQYSYILLPQYSYILLPQYSYILLLQYSYILLLR